MIIYLVIHMGNNSYIRKVRNYAALAASSAALSLAAGVGDVKAAAPETIDDLSTDQKNIIQQVDQAQMKPALQDILGPDKKAVMEETAPAEIDKTQKEEKDNSAGNYVKSIPGNVFGGLAKITGAVTGITQPVVYKDETTKKKEAAKLKAAEDDSPNMTTALKAAGAVSDVMMVSEPTMMATATVGGAASNLYNELKDGVREDGALGIVTGVGSFLLNTVKGVGAIPFKVVDGVTQVVGLPTDTTGSYAKIVSSGNKKTGDGPDLKSDTVSQDVEIFEDTLPVRPTERTCVREMALES